MSYVTFKEARQLNVFLTDIFSLCFSLSVDYWLTTTTMAIKVSSSL